MTIYFDAQIEQLLAQQGGYRYVRVGAEWLRQHLGVAGGRPRLLCALDQLPPYACGLSHLGDGDYFLILSAARLRALGKGLGAPVRVGLALDPDPLGVPLTEVLEVLLAQEPDLAAIYERLPPGRRRTLAIQVGKIKDLDRQISQARALLAAATAPRSRRA